MTDLIKAVEAKADVIWATVFTRSFQFEGKLHCPRVGKGRRLLSNMLNSGERRFIAMTDVRVTDRVTGKTDAKIHAMLQVSLEAIEYISPESDFL